MQGIHQYLSTSQDGRYLMENVCSHYKDGNLAKEDGSTPWYVVPRIFSWTKTEHSFEVSYKIPRSIPGSTADYDH